MELTREQFDDIGPFYLDDFCVDVDQDIMFKLFKCLPHNIQCTAIEWNCGDTVFRDQAFTYLCEKCFELTPEEYYKSEVFKKFRDFFEENDFNHAGMPQLFDWSKLNDGKE